MDRRECDTHISTHARVVRIVVVAAVAIENISREKNLPLSISFANINLPFSSDS